MLRAHLRFGIALTFGVLMIPAAAAALDPSCAVSQYVVRRWDAQSELQNASIRAFVQTKDHYLWLGTASGLARFDGSRFLFLDATRAPALGEGGISALATSPNGLLYFGTTSGAVVSYETAASRACRRCRSEAVL
jgi:ligand-binding sensor domain-containing protein